MNHGKSIPVNLHILDKDYVIACPEEKRNTLITSAQFLNEKVQEVRDGGKVASTERILVISALNIIHEYLLYKQGKEGEISTINTEVSRLAERVEAALLESEQSKKEVQKCGIDTYAV